ncbi:MAG: DsbA family protein [Myxococcales bacterium]|nr:DsbA family protein [Myxococcales bacterium]
MSRTVSFGYWSDPMCIWAFVAQRKLDALLRRHGDVLAVDYRVVPVFGSVPERFSRGAWSRSGVAGRVEATARIAAEHGHPEVTGEVWAHDPPSSSWAAGAPIKAVIAGEAAGEVPEGLSATYQWRLRCAMFVENRNIARRDVQLAVAEELDLARAPIERRLDDGSALAALFEDHQERERLRIQGSPTYVFDGGRAMLYGNFDEAVLGATVEALVAGLKVGGSAC